MPSSVVSVVKGERGHEPVFRALDLIDFKNTLAGFSKVMIKVNFICDKTWDSGATTDPLVVEAIILKLKTLDPSLEIFVVESDATMTNADEAFEVTGMAEMCRRNGVKWLNLRRIRDKVKLQVPGGEALGSLTVPRLVLESAIISVAKLKTHTATTVTLGMKNMFGLLPDKFKAKFHARGISGVIVDINSVLHSRLTVIDGFVGMEGNGPVNGAAVKMDLIIAGADVVATDAIGCRVMDIDPVKVKHIRRANEKGLGSIDPLVVGESLVSVVRSFQKAKS